MRRAIVLVMLWASDRLDQAAVWFIGTAAWVQYLGYSEPKSDDQPWKSSEVKRENSGD